MHSNYHFPTRTSLRNINPDKKEVNDQLKIGPAGQKRLAGHRDGQRMPEIRRASLSDQRKDYEK